MFINGKQKRVRRAQPLVEGLPADEFIRRNADPIWLHQNEMWEYMDTGPDPAVEPGEDSAPSKQDDDDAEIPF